ncbi:MAG: hypothetical protein L6R42_006474, partial [Xanthoria sp. 1 TBL-2021]
FPPGFPDKPYVYTIRYSDFTLVCYWSHHEPRMNITWVEVLMRRLISVFIDSRKTNILLPRGVFKEPANPTPGTIITSLEYIKVPFEERRMTYGIFLHVLRGTNNMRLDYPHLNFGCSVEKEGHAKDDFGIVRLDDGLVEP